MITEEKRDDFATLYDKLWKECNAWCMDNLEGEDIAYYLDKTD